MRVASAIRYSDADVKVMATAEPASLVRSQTAAAADTASSEADGAVRHRRTFFAQQVDSIRHCLMRLNSSASRHVYRSTHYSDDRTGPDNTNQLATTVEAKPMTGFQESAGGVDTNDCPESQDASCSMSSSLQIRSIR